jgi:putative peptidoglycan lipid II flippase
MRPEEPRPARPSLARHASTVSLAVIASRILGLVRDQVFAGLFGAGLQYDAFLAAFRIPNLLRDLFAEGALSAAFVTTFTQVLENKGQKEAARLSNRVATALILVLGVLCVFGWIFAPALVYVLAPGFFDVPGKAELTIVLTRIMMPFILFVALAAQAMGILNARENFAVPAIAPAFFNLGSIFAGLFFGFVIGPSVGLSPIEGMAVGTVLGGLLQLAVQWPSLHRAGFRYRPTLNFTDPGLIQIVRLMGPAVIGTAAVQINVFVNTNFASFIIDPATGAIANGPVSWINYAFRFMQFPIGVFGVAIATATLPPLSRSTAHQEYGEFRRILAHSLVLVFLLCIPSAVGLAVLGRPIIAPQPMTGRELARAMRALGSAVSWGSPARFSPERASREARERMNRPRSLARRRRRLKLAACGLAAAAAVILAVGWTVVLNRQAIRPASSELATSNASSQPERAAKPPRATFVGGPDMIVIPVDSPHRIPRALSRRHRRR